MDIRDLADRMWKGELDTVFEYHPVSTRMPEGNELADGVLWYKGIASATAIDAGDSLVMLDTGAVNDTRPLHEAIRAWAPNKRLAAAVFSHHHVDHIFGVGPFEEEASSAGFTLPIVYAHENVPTAFDRYVKTLGWNTAINIRQFALPPDRFRWQEHYRYPDVTYRDGITFQAGDLTFELTHARGETDDATWTWIPERRILAPGDLFIWATPNAGNPQKVQRYVGEWATALREMAPRSPELIIPGHGLPIFGADRAQEALIDTADLLDSLENQTIALMNQGVTLDRILHEVQPPAHLMAKPFLRPVYDHPQFIVRNVWRLYGGWWDGEFDTILPAPRAEQAREWVALAGGLEAVLKRTEELRVAGNLAMACHLVEYAVLAAPGSKEAHALRAEVYSQRSKLQESSMARNIMNHAALASAAGKRDLASEYVGKRP